MTNELLWIKDLKVSVNTELGLQDIVRNVHFRVGHRKIVALVGGSGSGKTTMGLTILRLLSPAMRICSGEIFFDGRDIMKLSPDKVHRLRGKEIGMVFQEPLSAFNPVLTIGTQLSETLKYHTPLNSAQIKDRMAHLLESVGLTDVKRVLRSYPHHLSGGMRQRAMIAQAIAGDPKLVIADEPTSNLDVTLQAQIIDLFKKLREELKISIMLITHDLGVVKEMADEVNVLFSGSIVESGPVNDVFLVPRHAYTSELVKTLAE